MPIIMHRRDDYKPGCAWKDDTSVQWGGHGVVLGKNPYATAFFEVFPASGGFIRGEGETIELAEKNAFKAWQREEECNAKTGHRWVRQRPRGSLYLNGGTFCARCGSFKTTMAPVVTLGDWKTPLTISDLYFLSIGLAAHRKRRSRSTDQKLDRSVHRMLLKAKRAGIILPDESDPQYADKCTQVIKSYCLKNEKQLRADAASSGDGFGLAQFFETMAESHLFKE